jgi:AcrR family transcriptional regulator
MIKQFQPVGTSKKIADKAHDLFIRYGIRNVSMDDIATNLGISKKTIYRFYSNKDSLVEALVKSETDKNAACCKTLTAKSGDVITELYFLLVYAKDFYDILNPAIIHDLEKHHEVAYNKLNDHKTLFLHQTFKASIERGIKGGLFRNVFDVDVIVKFFLESLSLILNPGIFPPVHYNKIRLAEELFVNLINGIVTASGMKVTITNEKQWDIACIRKDEGGCV